MCPQKFSTKSCAVKISRILFYWCYVYLFISMLPSAPVGLQEHHDHREYHDFVCVLWFLAVTMILRHSPDYWQIVYKISTYLL